MQNRGRLTLTCFLAGGLMVAACCLPNILRSATPEADAVVRTNEHMRGIATALAAYREDHQAFPNTDDLSEAKERHLWIVALTTPVAYLAPNSVEPMSAAARNRRELPLSTLYYVSENGKCALGAYGPDGDRDVSQTILESGLKVNAVGALRLYDPTNGIQSDGDLLLILD